MSRENLEQLISMWTTYSELSGEIKTLWFDKVSRECVYFYHHELATYGQIDLIRTEILEGEVCCKTYYVDPISSNIKVPSIQCGKHYIKISDFRDEIELLSKEDFVNGLKKELQDALDNM